jgi:curli biogenesis system outer membrane secretion channel CsgG
MSTKTLSTLVFLAICFWPAGVFAKSEKLTIAVAEFKNETAGQGGGGAYWWTSPSVGRELSGMLSNELMATRSFNVLERQNLEAALTEQDLGASGRIAQDSAAPIGQVTGAQYLVMGTVTSYEENTASTGGGIGFKGFSIGGSSTEAYIAVDVRVMNSTTGALEYVRTIEGSSKGSSMSLGAFKSGFGGTLATQNKTPAGKAIRAALVYITDYLECAMIKQDRCLDEFDAADDRRREKTKSTLELD